MVIPRKIAARQTDATCQTLLVYDLMSDRAWFEIQMIPPENTPEGWVDDGRVRISIGEGRELSGSFLLSIDEVFKLIRTLDAAVDEHEAAKTNLWRV
jgi:hypothetical protein